MQNAAALIIKGIWRHRPHRAPYFAALAGFILTVVLFGALAEEVHEGATQVVDKAILINLRSAVATPGLDDFMRAATDVGGKLFVGGTTAALIAFLLYRHKRSAALILTLAMGGLAVAVLVLKLLFARERPDGVGAIVREDTFSFPSGHTMASAGLAMTIILLLWHTKWRKPALVLGVLYAVFVGFSRLYLGVHYPTDVLAGWLLAIGWVATVFAIFKPRHRQSTATMSLVQRLRVFAKHHFTDHPHDGPVQDVLLNESARLGFDLQKHYALIKKLDVRFKVSVLQTVSYQNKQYPIYCIDYQPDADGQRLFILAGSHGNEEAGLLATEDFIKYLAEDKSVAGNVAVRILTPHNPIGAAHFSRYNGQGIDMNRDFVNGKTVETRAVMDAMRQFKPTVTIALHEGPQEAGTFFFTNRCVKDELVTPLLTELSRQNVELANKSYFGNKLKLPGQFPSKGTFGFLTRLWVALFKFQGFGAYCADQGIPALVMETPWTTTDRSQRVDAQLIALKALTRSLV